MSVVEASPGKTAGRTELAFWSALVFLAGAFPGLGLAVGLLLSLTRLREHRTARVAIPALGAVASVFWALGLWSGSFGDSGIGGPGI
jgi:hypothetical protein